MDGTVFWKLPVQFEALLKITHIADWLHIPVYFKILSLHSQVLKIHFSHKYADKNGRRVRIVTLPRFLYICKYFSQKSLRNILWNHRLQWSCTSYPRTLPEDYLKEFPH